MDDKTKNTLLTVGTIGVLLFGASKLFGGVGTFLRGGVKAEDAQYIKDKYATFKELVTALSASIDQTRLSFNRGIYKVIAEKQYTAMKVLGYTDEKALFDSLNNLNTDDLKLVFIDYGLRSEGYDILGHYRKDLIQWYFDELSGETLQKMTAIWKPTGLMQ